MVMRLTLAILSAMVACVSARAPLTKSYYEVMGVKKDCSNLDLKKSYRALSLKYHPDRHVDPKEKQEAEETFVVIAKANEVLTNKVARGRYDDLLKDGIFEYDEESWEERQARKNGWRSQEEIDSADSSALMISGLALAGGIGWTMYQIWRKQAEALKKTEKKKAEMLSKANKERSMFTSSARASSAKELNPVRKANLLKQHMASYQKNLAAWHKSLRKTFRECIVNHGLWFAPVFSTDDIGTLLSSLPVDELVLHTRQLSKALARPLPRAPTPPDGSKAEDADVLPPTGAKSVLNVLVARVPLLSPAEEKK